MFLGSLSIQTFVSNQHIFINSKESKNIYDIWKSFPISNSVRPFFLFTTTIFFQTSSTWSTVPSKSTDSSIPYTSSPKNDRNIQPPRQLPSDETFPKNRTLTLRFRSLHRRNSSPTKHSTKHTIFHQELLRGTLELPAKDIGEIISSFYNRDRNRQKKDRRVHGVQESE